MAAAVVASRMNSGSNREEQGNSLHVATALAHVTNGSNRVVPYSENETDTTVQVFSLDDPCMDVSGQKDQNVGIKYQITEENGSTPTGGICDGQIQNDLPEGSLELGEAQVAKMLKSRMNEYDLDTSLQHLKQSHGFSRNAHARTYLDEKPVNGSDYDLFCWNVAVMMDSTPAKGFIVSVIIVNALAMGAEADNTGDDTVFQILEYFFLAVFTVELICNLIGFGKLYFADSCNTLDFIIVIISWIDFFITIATDGSNPISLIKLIRVVRILRVVTFLSVLMQLLRALQKGMESALWVLLLLMLVLYGFAVMARTLFGPETSLADDIGDTVDLESLFGSVPKSFVTLIQLYIHDSSISGVQRPIGEARPAAWLFFFTFMLIVTIGLLELLTAVFIESLLEEKKLQDQKTASSKTKLRSDIHKLLSGLFDTFDSDGNATLDLAEMARCNEFFDHPDTKTMMEYVDADVSVLKQAVELADLDGDSNVTRQEFIDALESIYEAPTRADIRTLHQRISALKRQHADSFLELKQEMDAKANETNRRLDDMMRVQQAILEKLGGSINQVPTSSGQQAIDEEIRPHNT